MNINNFNTNKDFATFLQRVVDQEDKNFTSEELTIFNFILADKYSAENELGKNLCNNALSKASRVFQTNDDPSLAFKVFTDKITVTEHSKPNLNDQEFVTYLQQTLGNRKLREKTFTDYEVQVLNYILVDEVGARSFFGNKDCDAVLSNADSLYYSQQSSIKPPVASAPKSSNVQISFNDFLRQTLSNRGLRKELFTDSEIQILNYVLCDEVDARLALGNKSCDAVLSKAKKLYHQNQPQAVAHAPVVGSNAKKERIFIKNFVSSFLTPYITRQITEETDDKNRKAMIESLLENNFNHLTKNEIEDLALQAFIEKSAYGLYIHLRIPSNTLNSKSLEFQVLIESLQKALPKEFPNKDISDLRKRAAEALTVVNQQRINEKKFVEGTGNGNDRYSKLAQLRRSNKNFF